MIYIAITIQSNPISSVTCVVEGSTCFLRGLNNLILLQGQSDHLVANSNLSFPVKRKFPHHEEIRDDNKADIDCINSELRTFYQHFSTTLYICTIKENWLQFETNVPLGQQIRFPNIKTEGHNPWQTKRFKTIENKNERIFKSTKISGS